MSRSRRKRARKHLWDLRDYGAKHSHKDGCKECYPLDKDRRRVNRKGAEARCKGTENDVLTEVGR